MFLNILFYPRPSVKGDTIGNLSPANPPRCKCANVFKENLKRHLCVYMYMYVCFALPSLFLVRTLSTSAKVADLRPIQSNNVSAL